MKQVCLAMLVAGMGASYVGAQTVIVNDHFDYADEAGLHAVWVGNPASNQAAIEDSFDLTTEPGSGPNADYNANGTVDAADYVVWRNDPAAHGGDPTGYHTWRQQ